MAKYDGTVEKQPAEQMRIRHNFGPALREAELLTAVISVTAKDLDDDSDATSLIVSDDFDIESNNKWVYYGLKGGVDGKKYLVTIRAATDEVVGTAEGGVVEADHLITVKEK